MYSVIARVGIALVLFILMPAAGAQTPPPPLVKPEGLRQISTHVQVIPDNSVPLVPNVGFIVGDTGLLVVDTGMGNRNGAAVAAVAQRLAGSRMVYLVATHFHPEHDLGAHMFPAATKMLRSADQEKDIAEFGLDTARTFAKRSAINAELLDGATYRKADITFDAEHTLDLGGLRVRLMAVGANHTRGDTVIWVEPDRVLFAGDTAMKAQPAFASPYSTVRQWLATLDKLAALNPTVVVPSHGPLGDGAFMANYRTYLAEVRDRVAAEKRNKRSVEQATEAVTAAMTDRYPDRGRLGGAVRAAYAEAP